MRSRQLRRRQRPLPPPTSAAATATVMVVVVSEVAEVEGRLLGWCGRKCVRRL
jgi:hypothetical protein